MAVVGKVLEIARKLNFEFEWKIDNFFSLSEEVGTYYDSPLFPFANEFWYLKIFPNGDSVDESVGYIDVFLYKQSHVSTIRVQYSIWMKTVDGKKVGEIKHTISFEKESDAGKGQIKCFERSELSEKKSVLVPSDVLTLVCKLDHSKSQDFDGFRRTQCNYCKETFDVNDVWFHGDMCLDKPIKCPICNENVKLKKWFEHECQMGIVTANKKFVDDLTDIFKSEKHSDITIKVRDDEFHLHWNILVGRNSYFRSMFNTEMRENTTGIVFIDDCEPEIFSSLAGFLYTGKMPTMSDENVCDLYEAADKFQEDQLKTECLSFMKNKMSVDNFFDFIILSLKHDNKELLQGVTEFFCRNTKEIIQSTDWQTFLIENPIQVTELIDKLADYKAK